MSLLDVRCARCGQLLFRAAGLGTVIEIKCGRCGTLLIWPALSVTQAVTVALRLALTPDGTKLAVVNATPLGGAAVAERASAQMPTPQGGGADATR
jgi:phage FluMu protein Com